jgi:uncharacterized RDD family membrane protein YckC
MGETEALTRMTDPLAPTPAPAPAPAPAAGLGGTTGLVYADVPNRAIAYIIDSIILGVIFAVVFGILAGIGLATSSIANGASSFNYLGGIIFALVGLAISAGYFIYTWTSMRATIGMRILGMQIGNAGDGKTLTTDQAVRRWLALGAPFSIVQAFNPFPLLGILIGLAAFVWFLYLLYTTYSSPTKQGFHDVFANTMVVKAVRTVA